MKLSVISKTKEKLVFGIDGEDYWFVNSLRRIMVNEVPTLAIEDVEFRKNDSALYDEIIALRLGLLPIKTDLQVMNLKEDCTCKGSGCSLCQVVFTLKEKGPKAVYAKHLKSKDAKMVPAFPDMLLVKLGKNQAIELEAIAILGRGKEHMKWSPCLAFYKYSPDLKLAVSKCGDKGAEIVELCPQNVFEMKAGKLAIVDKKVPNCHFCNACVEGSPEGCITLNINETKHIFTVESWGQLSPDEIVMEATKIFEDKLTELSKMLKTRG